LTRSVGDLTNLKNSTQIATIILDSALHIRDYTPPMTGLLHPRDADRGRPVTDLVSRLDYESLQDDAERVIRDLTTIEHEIALKEHDRTFLMRMLPYRTADNVIDGIVMTFVGISDRKRHEHERGMLSRSSIPHSMRSSAIHWRERSRVGTGRRRACLATRRRTSSASRWRRYSRPDAIKKLKPYPGELARARS
jgi:hypothetical protein